MKGVMDFMRHIDYAVWLRSRGKTCSEIAETFGVGEAFVRSMTNRSAREQGIDLPKRGRPRKEVRG